MGRAGRKKRSGCSSQKRTRPPFATLKSTREFLTNAVRAGYSCELRRFLQALEAVTATSGIDDDAVVVQRLSLLIPKIQRAETAAEFRASEPAKWLLSLELWFLYCTEEDGRLFDHLPFAIHLDCVFFLQQRWVAELIADLRETRPSQLKTLLFGRPKKGVTSFEAALQREERDLKLCGEIERLRIGGLSLEKAMFQVGEQSGELVGQRLSGDAIRSMYKNRRQGRSPFERLLSPT